MTLIKKSYDWIKVGDEEPPIFEPLIICHKGKFYYEADDDPVWLYGHVIVGYYTGSEWLELDPYVNQDCDFETIDDVTHWRRLPHPPRH
jgi:hypothetical protein